MPDLTLDLVIPFLWSRNLPLLDGIYESFTVFYGDHFDRHSRGFGQKGVLDFTILPLISRKLIADTYLDERRDSYIFNCFAWIIALPIKTITFGVSLALTLAIIPIIAVITLFRYLSSPSGGTGGAGGAVATAPDAYTVILSTQTAYTALHEMLIYLERMDILNPDNIRRLLQEPQNLALIYAIEHLTHVVDANNIPMDNQQLFDFLIEHRDFWTDIRVIDNLTDFTLLNNPLIRFDELQREVRRPVVQVIQDFNGGQSTHTASVHNSTSKSAVRLQEFYQHNTIELSSVDDISIAQMIRHYDT